MASGGGRTLYCLLMSQPQPWVGHSEAWYPTWPQLKHATVIHLHTHGCLHWQVWHIGCCWPQCYWYYAYLQLSVFATKGRWLHAEETAEYANPLKHLKLLKHLVSASDYHPLTALSGSLTPTVCLMVLSMLMLDLLYSQLDFVKSPPMQHGD